MDCGRRLIAGPGKVTMPVEKFDIAIIGAGSGGLSVAAGAAQMGARTVLIEKGEMGGDCLNSGCVPSKSLIAAGETAETFRHASQFGVASANPVVDFAAVHAHVHGVIGAIAPHDSVERFRGLGVDVIQAPGRFVSSTEIEAGGRRIKARRFVIATGSRAIVPPIPGIDTVKAYTNETIFTLTTAPTHLVIVGGGPIGIEMAQAHRRLGCAVTVLELAKIMPRDDADAVGVVRARLLAEGITLMEGVKIERIAAGNTGAGVAVHINNAGAQQIVEGSHLLVAAGRRVNIENLGLDAAGIASTPRGITVDARLRTTNKSVFAIGDVAGSYQFTHIAGYHAGIVIRNALFNVPAKVDLRAVPWVTYTDPELAQVGLTEAAAKAPDSKVTGATAVSWQFTENDRAQAERDTQGFIKVVVAKNGKILGATIVGRHAGELLLPWVLAVQKGMSMRDMTGIIAPYPTRSEVSKRVAGAYFTPTLFSNRTRSVVRWMQWLP
jgi:pyruvate/2-oxoglutarate dehydrogenase complex dihydrolipoamide dehydrogenase (E3) component